MLVLTLREVQPRALTSLGQQGYQAPYLVVGNVHTEYSVKQGVKVMTYVMTKPCPICKQQLTKKVPTDTVQCPCGKHVWQG